MSGPDLDALALAAFDPDAAPACVGVAVSGGSDSLATLSILSRHYPVAAVTVDHGLRPEAAQEAAGVAAYCGARGIPHEILRWEGPAPAGNLMDQARRARLALIGAWARRRGVTDIALGHTADDQAETFLMRLGRRAGLEGLAGMRARFVAEGVLWHRPFLGVPRAALRAHLLAEGTPWAEDPSNSDPRFARVRARAALAGLGAIGITAEGLAEVTAHLAAAEALIAEDLYRWAAQNLREEAGDLTAEQAALTALAPERRRRLLNAALRWVAGAEYGPRAEALARIVAAPGAATLHGCRISLARGLLRITREAAATAPRAPAVAGLWDRWRLVGPAEPGLEIGPLGAEGLAQIAQWRAGPLPRPSLLSSPAIWAGETLIAAPLARAERDWRATPACGSFHATLIRR